MLREGSKKTFVSCSWYLAWHMSLVQVYETSEAVITGEGIKYLQFGVQGIIKR